MWVIWLVSGSLPLAIMGILVLIGMHVVRMVAVDIDHVEDAPHHGGLHISEHGHCWRSCSRGIASLLTTNTTPSTRDARTAASVTVISGVNRTTRSRSVPSRW